MTMLRATELTRQILDRPGATVDPTARVAIHGSVAHALTAINAQGAIDRRQTITLSLVRRTAHGSVRAARSEPTFAWRPAYVRRSLGLAAIEACIDTGVQTPAEVMATVAASAVDTWSTTGWRTFHWEPWFASLGRGGQAAVLAEATTWATSLWFMVDWASLRGRVVLGGPDDRWTLPGYRGVCLRGRAEARIGHNPPGRRARLSGERRCERGQTLISVSSGTPGSAWRAELGYLALVASLRAPAAPAPVRVVGLWPSSAESRIVDVDAGVLSAGGELVVVTAEALAGLDKADGADHRADHRADPVADRHAGAGAPGPGPASRDTRLRLVA